VARDGPSLEFPQWGQMQLQSVNIRDGWQRTNSIQTDRPTEGYARKSVAMQRCMPLQYWT
jgi:hypothetical protein